MEVNGERKLPWGEGVVPLRRRRKRGGSMQGFPGKSECVQGQCGLWHFKGYDKTQKCHGECDRCQALQGCLCNRSEGQNKGYRRKRRQELEGMSTLREEKMVGRFDRGRIRSILVLQKVATVIVQTNMYIPATVLSAFHVVNPQSKSISQRG